MNIQWPRSDVKQNVIEWDQELQSARKLAVEALRHAQAKQQEIFDSKRGEVKLEVGQSVWLRVPVPEGEHPKLYNTLRGPYQILELPGNDTAVIQHFQERNRKYRVNVERLIKARLRTEVELDEKERQIIQGNLSHSQQSNDNGKYDPNYIIVIRIWGHRHVNDADIEFLVQWETTRPHLEGKWIHQDQVDAPEILSSYWERYYDRALDPVPEWKHKCSHNGSDHGCEHLLCKSRSWFQAMEENGYVPLVDGEDVATADMPAQSLENKTSVTSKEINDNAPAKRRRGRPVITEEERERKALERERKLQDAERTRENQHQVISQTARDRQSRLSRRNAYKDKSKGKDEEGSESNDT